MFFGNAQVLKWLALLLFIAVSWFWRKKPLQNKVNSIYCLGAGEQKRENFVSYNKLSKRACVAGIKILNNGGSALEAVREAVVGKIKHFLLIVVTHLFSSIGKQSFN